MIDSAQHLNLTAYQAMLGGGTTDGANYMVIGNTTDSVGSTATLFDHLVATWKRDTAHLSSIEDRMRHPAVLGILGLPDAVRLILDELDRDPDHWFFALYQLTGENPIPGDFRGTIREAADIWVDWGNREGITNNNGESRPLWVVPQPEGIQTSANVT